MSRRKSRTLSPEDRHLWRKVTETVKPKRQTQGMVLRDQSQMAAQTDPKTRFETGLKTAPQAEQTDGKITNKMQDLTGKTGGAKPPAKPPFLSPYRPPVSQPQIQSHLAGFDHKSRKRLKRGQDRLDGTIDLHGLNQEAAHRRLVQFLIQAQRDGARYVLVITGKGRSDNPQTGTRGVLRRAVPHWLTSAELAHLVVGYDTAHIAHGGTGALYVRLRKSDPQGRRPV